MAKAAIKLYKIERKAKDDKLDPKERYDYRLEHPKPLVEEYEAWLDKHYPTVLPELPLGKAFPIASGTERLGAIFRRWAARARQ